MCADGKLEIAENGKKWDAENMAKRNLNGFGQLAMGLLGQGQHNQLLPPFPSKRGKTKTPSEKAFLR